MLIQGDGPVYDQPCVNERLGRVAEVRPDVVLEAFGEPAVLGGEPEQLDALALAGVLLQQLVAVALLAYDLRMVVGHAVLLHAKQAGVGLYQVVDETVVTIHVGHAVLAPQVADGVASVHVAEMSLEFGLER